MSVTKSVIKMKGPLYKRIVLKLSGGALGDRAGLYDWSVVNNLCNDLGRLVQEGILIAVVVGGGNILRGRELDRGQLDRDTADTMGMLATVMNGLALREALQRHGVPVKLMSALHVSQAAELYEPFSAKKYLEDGYVLVLSGGTGHPFFSTDTGAALRAAELGADALLKATNVPGVFDRDPHRYTTAKIYTKLTYQQVIKQELGVMDLTAITLCKDNLIPVRVFDLLEKDALVNVCFDRSIGTTITAANNGSGG